MGFLLPAALVSLAAAGIPFLIHLMRRRDLPERDLPTWSLLVRAEAESRSRVRLVDVLLLVVRASLVAALGVALAAPFFERTIAFGDGTPVALALVVDDSMSMTRRGPEGVPLERARTRAERILESLTDGSEVTLVFAGSPPRAVTQSNHDPAIARAALRALGADSARGTDVPGAVALAARELGTSKLANRRLVVLSDLADHGGWSRVEWPPNVPTDVERFDATGANLALGHVEAVPDPTRPNDWAVALEATGGTGTTPFEVRVGDAVRARGQLRFDEGRARTQLDVAKGTPAAVTVKLLGDDAMEADNGRTVLVEGAVRTSCLVISGDADRGAGQSASRFLMKALAAASSEGAPMDARLADPDGVSSAELSAADVVILSDVSRPSSAFSAALRRYVMEGGGLWVAAGPHFDPAAYRARLGDLLPARLGTAARDASGLGLGDAGSLAAIANGLRGAEVRGRILFDDWGADDLVLLSFTDGSPALVERTAGKGRVALLATSLDDSWSAFPFRVGFVPFVAQMVMRLAEGGGAGRREIAPGFPHVLAKPDGTVRLEVRGPDGARIAVTEQGVVTDTTRPGLYTVHVETSRAALAPRPALAFTVAPDPAESGFERTTASMPTGTAASAARDSRAKLPLAPWWFLAAALLVAVEGVLRLGRRRFRASAEVSSPSA